MLNKLRKSKQQEGFTIIEVMIVLAIAGLIILVVLLAVPALQRNGRNTAIKNDASAVTGAINEFKSNNDGISPLTAVSDATGNLDVNGATGSAKAEGKVQAGTTVGVATSVPTASSSSNGNIYVYFQHTCDAPTVTNKRAVSVYYPVEQKGGTPVLKCIDS